MTDERSDTMLSRADLNYAQRAAQEWADWNADYVCDDDEREHFARYFARECDEANTLDVSIPSMFDAWRLTILPALRPSVSDETRGQLRASGWSEEKIDAAGTRRRAREES